MNKAQLVNAIAAEADITKASAERALDAFTNAVSNSLTKGEDVTILGFGSFTTQERKERKGRNPQTGEAITIAAATLPKFKAGKALKDAVNQ
ncbi:HU family DNA-binding protein [Pseudoalteromonas sp.]|uniref:HU family DNA-binding protein n=1 Tax=Pseudoalteromonas sp. TaxID=53249 RepID=UPI002729981D|nr:HU family DNA-binding protein [Pseudoalteromonas sp.]